MPSARRDTFRTNLYCRHLRPERTTATVGTLEGLAVNTACPHPDCPCVSGRCLRSHCPPEHVQAFDDALQVQHVTPGLILIDPDHVPCDGSMTCQCDKCAEERARFVKRGGIGGGNASPFRRAAA